MPVLTDQKKPQYASDMTFVMFERLDQQQPRWYHRVYRHFAAKLQLRPMVYGHVCIVMYSSSHDKWYLIESKYNMGDKDNGPSVGTLTDEVIVIPQDTTPAYTLALIADDDDELLMYDAVRVSGVDGTSVLLRAELLCGLHKPTAWDFVSVYLTGTCRAYLCTDYVTTVLGLNIPFVTTCDALHELVTIIY